MKDQMFTQQNTQRRDDGRAEKESFPNKIKTLDRAGKGEGYGQQFYER